MCWHVKAWACRLLQSHPLSVLPFVLAECCVSSSHNSKFLCSPKIFSISVCVWCFLAKAGPPSHFYCEGNSVPCVCGFQGAFKENKALRPRSPSLLPSSFLLLPLVSPHSLTPCGTFCFLQFPPPHFSNQPASSWVTELISYASYNPDKSIITANGLSRVGWEGEWELGGVESRKGREGKTEKGFLFGYVHYVKEGAVRKRNWKYIRKWLRRLWCLWLRWLQMSCSGWTHTHGYHDCV